MKRGIRHQGGMSLVEVLFYALVAIFALTVILKLGPHYMDYLELRSVMKEVANDPELAREGRLGISESLANRLYINYIKNVRPGDFKYEKTTSGYLVSVKYKVKEHLFANVDVLLNFSYQVHVDWT